MTPDRVIASFTGTRSGMTPEQRKLLARLLERDLVEVLVHGDCTGADSEADALARLMEVERWTYPSNVERFRAHCERRGALIQAPPRPPLVRNESIVLASPTLYVVSETMSETMKSGTWSCCRVARRHGRAVITVLWPDGSESDGRRSLLSTRTDEP